VRLRIAMVKIQPCWLAGALPISASNSPMNLMVSFAFNAEKNPMVVLRSYRVPRLWTSQWEKLHELDWEIVTYNLND